MLLQMSRIARQAKQFDNTSIAFSLILLFTGESQQLFLGVPRHIVGCRGLRIHRVDLNSCKTDNSERQEKISKQIQIMGANIDAKNAWHILLLNCNNVLWEVTRSKALFVLKSTCKFQLTSLYTAKYHKAFKMQDQ